MKVFSQSSLLTNVKPKGPLLWRLLTKTYILSLLFCVLIYYWKDHKHTDKNKMTVRDLKKWCWLSYCSPKHYFVRHSGKCSEYHRLDGAGALFSSFASFQYVEELQLLLVKFLRPDQPYLCSFPLKFLSFFQRIFGFPCSCERSKEHEKADKHMAIPSSIILLSHHQEPNSVPYSRGCKYWCQLWDLDWLGPKKDDSRCFSRRVQHLCHQPWLGISGDTGGQFINNSIIGVYHGIPNFMKLYSGWVLLVYHIKSASIARCYPKTCLNSGCWTFCWVSFDITYDLFGAVNGIHPWHHEDFSWTSKSRFVFFLSSSISWGPFWWWVHRLRDWVHFLGAIIWGQAGTQHRPRSKGS